MPLSSVPVSVKTLLPLLVMLVMVGAQEGLGEPPGVKTQSCRDKSWNNTWPLGKTNMRSRNVRRAAQVRAAAHLADGVGGRIKVENIRRAAEARRQAGRKYDVPVGKFGALEHRCGRV